MKKIELSKGNVTIIEGIDEIDAYTKKEKRYKVAEGYKNRSCFMLCEFRANEIINKVQPLFFHNDCVKTIYDSTYYINYNSYPVFNELVNEFFLMHHNLQKYVGWNGLFDVLKSCNGKLYTKECDKIFFKEPVFRCDYPNVCITMDSMDGNLHLLMVKGNGFTKGLPNYGSGGESIELFYSFEDAKKAGLELFESSRKIYMEKLSDINNKIEKILTQKEE